jgi:hypothetical protein
MPTLVLLLFRFVLILFSGHAAVAMENAALRLQLAAFQRKRKRPTDSDDNLFCDCWLRGFRSSQFGDQFAVLSAG